MYVESLSIKHLKRISALTLPFRTERGAPRMLTVLIGENGTAKTSILQAIALAAAGPANLQALANGMAQHLRDRRAAPKDPLHVEVTFALSAEAADWLQTEAGLTSRQAENDQARLLSLVGDSGRGLNGASVLQFEGAGLVRRPEPVADPFAPTDWLDSVRSAVTAPGFFVAAYGVSRLLSPPNLSPTLSRPSLERLAPLFRPQAPLLGLAFADLLAQRSEADARAYVSHLRSVLSGPDGLLPTVDSIELRGQGGVTASADLTERDRFAVRMGTDLLKLPALSLSHGYQSIISLVADLLGHAYIGHGAPVAPADLEGLLLVDEIDLLLHPRWQQTILGAFRRHFPKLQVIATTHSPMVVAHVPPESIFVLEEDTASGEIVVRDYLPDGSRTGSTAPDPKDTPDPRAMTATELFREFFGADRLTLNPLGAEVRRAGVLANDPLRTEEEDRELTALGVTLAAAGVVPPVPVPRRSSP